MAVFAIPNPKKTIQVDFPIEKIKKSILNIPLLNKNYRFSSSNEIFNQFTFESFEFLSVGVFLDFHLNSISENKTEINLEIRRKIGSFNQPAEITNANNHIDKLFKYIAQLTSMNDEEIESLKQKINTTPPIKKKNGCLKIGLIIFGCFVGLGILVNLFSNESNDKKEIVNVIDPRIEKLQSQKYSDLPITDKTFLLDSFFEGKNKFEAPNFHLNELINNSIATSSKFPETLEMKGFDGEFTKNYATNTLIRKDTSKNINYDKGTFQVVREIRSENAFGTKVRNKVVVYVKFNGKGYEVVDFKTE
ncbi:hypothetical protein Q73A0000_03875 [Kaistella flava (ex Peng et al. 2021)]|uniref:Uncharacterized protein n=1 Tax=Kaistella flava (ex Peng et al. 2021) TaxID=2038776 RepID=A0A7M2Y838_9FLAO|nr:hypothetical protein [Kaistella flava (ex Peng et al. 2021)]QOW09562.1 hypothetical protein Q73A0000_03875 [Kaistella flava (ex Peng et al. 2021)]